MISNITVKGFENEDETKIDWTLIQKFLKILSEQCLRSSWLNKNDDYVSYFRGRPTEPCNHQTNEKERSGHDAKQPQSDLYFLLINDVMSYFQSVICLPCVCFYWTVRTTEIPGSHITSRGDIILQFCSTPGLNKEILCNYNNSDTSILFTTSSLSTLSTRQKVHMS